MTRIQYVEDNDDNVYTLKLRFGLLDGFEALIAENGRQPAPRRQGLVMAVGGGTPQGRLGQESRARWDRCKGGGQEVAMNEDVFNASIRKFLKALGVTAQREIEKAVRQALAEGRLKGNETFPARATVTLGGIGFSHEINGEIELG